jgi:transposase
MALGHDARLMPAQYVKPFLKGHKNDYRDAEACAEAVQRPTMRFVAAKTEEQLDLQALHRVRARLVRERTATVNAIRAFLLERGIAVAQGIHRLRKALPDIFAKAPDALSPRMVRIIENLAADWRRLDERVEEVSTEIEMLARKEAPCQRLMTVPGIGPLISSATVATIGAGDLFSKGRVARHSAKAALDRGPHHPGQNLQAWKQVFAHAVRAGRPSGAAKAGKLGALRPQELDRGCGQAASS